jgi:hypothetical protein
MYNSVKIHKPSASQLRNLKKGRKAIVKMGGDYSIDLSEEQAKKLSKASQKGKGLTIQLDPYQQDKMSGKGIIEEMDGEGLKDFVGKIKKAKIGKKIIKYAKDNKLLQKVGNALVERAVKTIAGSGRPRGRPPKNGGALLPAGGALLPAGGALLPAGGALLPAGYK